MKKFVITNAIALISVVGSLIMSSVLYGYNADKKAQALSIESEKKMRCTQDSLLWREFDRHKEKHADEEVQRIEREALMYKYLDGQFRGVNDKFDGVEKLIEARTE